MEFTVPVEGPEILSRAEEDSVLLVSEGDASDDIIDALEDALTEHSSVAQQTTVNCVAGASSPNKINAS